MGIREPFIWMSLLLVSMETRGEFPKPDHANLRVYLDEEGRLAPIRVLEEWTLRRRAILAGMQEAMGPLPDRSRLPEFDLRIGEETIREGYRRLTVSFVSGDPDRIPAYLYVPVTEPGAARRPAMLALHQTTDIGKDDVDGGGNNPNLAYARELAERGYVVLAPDYPPFGGYIGYDFESDRYNSGTMKGIFNHMRCVDLLVSLPEVDPERIGVIGHSLGGHNAMFAAVFDERLKAVVASCGWTPFHDYYGGKLEGWTSDRYMPRLRDVYGLNPDRVPFDLYEVVAALAPRAFFSNSPVGDENFDVNGVKKVIPAAREIYALHGVEDRLQVRFPECGHDFPPEVREEAYRFLDQVLNHAPLSWN